MLDVEYPTAGQVKFKLLVRDAVTFFFLFRHASMIWHLGKAINRSCKRKRGKDDVMTAKGRKKEKEPLLDMIGRPLSVGDAVAFRHRRFKMLECGRVIGFTNKMARVGWTIGGRESSYLVRTEDCAIISLDDYMMHALSRI